MVVAPSSVPMLAITCRSIADRQARPGSVVFQHAADRPVDVVPPQHFQHDVLGAHPIGERADQLDAPHAGHFDIKGKAGHRQRDFEPAGADGQHAHRAGGRRVAVGAQQRLARLAESLLVHGMADAVARTAVPDSKPAAGAFQEEMVVRVFGVFLDQIVIDVLDRESPSEPGPTPSPPARASPACPSRPASAFGRSAIRSRLPASSSLRRGETESICG